MNAFTEKIAAYPSAEQERIADALAFAREYYGERLSRNLDTASILIDLNLDPDTIIAVLLRDYFIENAKPVRGKDHSPETSAIEKRFGPLPLAEDAAKLARVSARGKSAHEAENIQKMFFAMASDIRTILIKLADALQTMRAEDFPEEEQKAAAQESLDIYAPLADRLGISWIKTELEDLALKCLNRDVYLQIKEMVALKRGERARFLESAQSRIEKEIRQAGINGELESRAKHFYSIYQKMRRRNKAPGDIFDLFGLRILCQDVDNCYAILGLVHRLWKPIDGRFKDYIARPKPNGYQSLHTSVFADQQEDASGQMLEIQIRTFTMHHIAEYGVAGHWMYKRGKAGDISLVNRLKKWNESDNSRFLDELRNDILKDSLYVFTPKGKVLSLPSGSTPLDFAYRIHSAVGEHCLAAKADGVIIPLGSALKSAQVVEIITSASSHPSRNWLNEVKTAHARSRIRSWLIQHTEGPQKSADKPPHKKKENKVQHIQAEEVLDPERYISDKRNIPVFKVSVDGEKNMMARFAKCCNPISGDSITGYVSRGRGIIIHRNGCGNLAYIPDFEERRIDVQWENAGFPVKRFKLEAKRKDMLFAEIENAVRKFRGRLIEGKLEELSDQHLVGYFTMQLESREDAAKIISRIRGIPSVFNIQNIG